MPALQPTWIVSTLNEQHCEKKRNHNPCCVQTAYHIESRSDKIFVKTPRDYQGPSVRLDDQGKAWRQGLQSLQRFKLPWEEAPHNFVSLKRNPNPRQLEKRGKRLRRKKVTEIVSFCRTLWWVNYCVTLHPSSFNRLTLDRPFYYRVNKVTCAPSLNRITFLVHRPSHLLSPFSSFFLIYFHFHIPSFLVTFEKPITSALM